MNRQQLRDRLAEEGVPARAYSLPANSQRTAFVPMRCMDGGSSTSWTRRSLAALSLAGLRPTDVQIVRNPPRAVRNRLQEPPLVGGPLPSRVTAVTPDRRGGNIMA